MRHPTGARKVVPRKVTFAPSLSCSFLFPFFVHFVFEEDSSAPAAEVGEVACRQKLLVPSAEECGIGRVTCCPGL